MKIEYSVKNIELTDTLRQIAEKKFKRLTKYLQNPENAKLEVHIERQRGTESVKVLMYIDGQVLIVRDEAPSALDALNSVVDVLEEKLMRRKDKYVSMTRNQPRLPEKYLEQGERQEEVQIGTTSRPKRLLRRKQIIESLTESQALRLMEESRSPVLVFFNRDTDTINVLYRSADDTYTLFEPIM